MRRRCHVAPGLVSRRTGCIAMETTTVGPVPKSTLEPCARESQVYTRAVSKLRPGWQPKVDILMSLRISGKHMDIGDAFRTRIEERISEALSKYFDGGFSGRVTVAKNGQRFSADCIVHLDTGAALQGTAEALDPQAAFDAAAEKVEKRLRRYKRRLKSHSPAQNATDIAYRVMAPVG